ncbi:MAG: dihydrodipicolinate synthase family protein [Opitutaceae bacterium]|nr:dihydrodipicolinate synthase family protein [Opitutaceae bacterium]
MSSSRKKVPELIAAIVTPLKADESLDVESLERLVEWVLGGGFGGFFVGGTMGEGLALRDSERERLVRETVRLVRGRAFVLAGISDASTLRLFDGISRIADAGVDGIVTTARLVFPARDRRDTERLVEAAAQRSPVPLWFYENPGMTPVRSTFDELQRIMAIPNVHGLKFTTPDRDLCLRCAGAFRGSHPVYNGNARDIAFAGQHDIGALVGIAGMLPGLCSRIWWSARRGDLAEAERLQRQVQEVYDIYLGESWPLWPSAQKHALKRLGIFSTSTSTAPFATLSSEEEYRIDAILDRLDRSIYDAPDPSATLLTSRT